MTSDCVPYPAVAGTESPGAVIEWVRDTGGTGVESLLADVAAPAVLVPASARAADVDALFRRDDALRCVVVDAETGPVLVDRSWFEAAITGPLGFGRVLHARSTIVGMVTDETLVFPHDLDIASAASAVISHRSPGTVANVVVVQWPDRIGVALVSTLFERLARHYAYQSLHDPLTQLPNRVYLMERIKQSLRDDWHAVLFYIDLDRFKDINDQLGHPAGDQVLVQFAARLRSAARAEDVVVRLGGDEFAVLTSTPLTQLQSAALAERLVLEAAAPFSVEIVDSAGAATEQLVTIGASVGVAHSDRPRASSRVTSLDVLLKQADIAMYRAKLRGRGRTVHYEPEMRVGLDSTEQTRARRTMERRLRTAIDGGTLTVHYQPVVELPSGRVTGAEALARWQDPELGNVSPDQFIPLAEATGLILDLGEWVLRTACAQAVRGCVDQGLSLSVNVSPVQLAQPGFADVVLRILAETGLPPARLCLEVTETAAISDLTETARRLAALRARGVRIALDDFGTGHSSLTMLRSLPLNIVKIDRSFVERVARSAQDAMLVRLVIDTAHTLGLSVCAEGIETVEQAQQLVSMGCDAAQGWYFGMPEPPSARLARTLDTQRRADGVDVNAVAPVPLTASDELVLITDPDGLIIYASSTSATLVGRTPQQLHGTSVHELAPACVPPAPEGVRRSDQDTTGPARRQMRHADGTLRWFDARTQELLGEDGTVTEVLSVLRDVTGALDANERALAREAAFRSAFDSATSAMALTDPVGTITQVNSALLQLLGRHEVELVGKTIADLAVQPPAGQENPGLVSAGGTPSARRDDVRTWVRGDGTGVSVLLRTTPLPSVRGEPLGAVVHVAGQPDPHLGHHQGPRASFTCVSPGWCSLDT